MRDRSIVCVSERMIAIISRHWLFDRRSLLHGTLPIVTSLRPASGDMFRADIDIIGDEIDGIRTCPRLFVSLGNRLLMDLSLGTTKDEALVVSTTTTRITLGTKRSIRMFIFSSFRSNDLRPEICGAGSVGKVPC